MNQTCRDIWTNNQIISFVFPQNPQFIRCILPNNERQDLRFEENLVLSQLKTSSTVAFANFMRCGYPKRISLQKIIDHCAPIEKKLRVSDTTQFYKQVLLWLGFNLQDFKMGKDTIFFRLNKFPLLETFFSDLEQAEKRNPFVPQRISPK